jgi:hypothetical protein
MFLVGPPRRVKFAKGVLGVAKTEDLAESGGERSFTALAIGKKIPAPSMEVVKYDTLVTVSRKARVR